MIELPPELDKLLTSVHAEDAARYREEFGLDDKGCDTSAETKSETGGTDSGAGTGVQTGGETAPVAEKGKE